MEAGCKVKIKTGETPTSTSTIYTQRTKRNTKDAPKAEKRAKGIHTVRVVNREEREAESGTIKGRVSEAKRRDGSIPKWKAQ